MPKKVKGHKLMYVKGKAQGLYIDRPNIVGKLAAVDLLHDLYN